MHDNQQKNNNINTVQKKWSKKRNGYVLRFSLSKVRYTFQCKSFRRTASPCRVIYQDKIHCYNYVR